MVFPNVFNDIRAIIKGIESVIGASVKHNAETYGKIWENSSIKYMVEDCAYSVNHGFRSMSQQNVSKTVKETVERTAAVFHGLKTLASYSMSTETSVDRERHFKKRQDDGTRLPKGVSPEDLKEVELDYKDKLLIRQLEMEHDLKLKLKEEKDWPHISEVAPKEIKPQEVIKNNIKPKQIMSNVVTSTDYVCNEKSDMKQNVISTNTHEVTKSSGISSSFQEMKWDPVINKKIEKPDTKKFKRKQELGPNAKQRKVPSSRIGRMFSFGSLAAGLGIGTLAEVARRTVGLGNASVNESGSLDQILMTEANAERIVNTLCRVRGAALKIGQILSIQDNTIISPTFQKAFERVRQSADFMPTWQVKAVLDKEIGEDWKSKISFFEEKPFAAASIGQVHYVRLKDGTEAAMKIQYPGVAEGIESDINNLVGILKIWNVFPKGLFIDNLVEVAKRELAWEVDYIREAECTRKFKELLAPYPDYVVPEVIDELSTHKIFTTTLIEGVPIDQCVNLSDLDKKHIAKLLMQLCLRELFEFRYMQTDPNWSNFFYDQSTGKMALLDFGASRSYEDKFISKYIEVIKAAMDGDRQTVLKISQDMGFLTGYESKAMQDAHVDAVVILAEVFSADREFDFGQQDTTLRIQKLVPTIVSERLCPPPEEIYSLHRKLSGIFLLCAKLKVKISCRNMFLDMYKQWKQRGMTST